MLLYLSPVLEEEDIPHKDKFKQVILQLKQEAMTDIVAQLRVRSTTSCIDDCTLKT